MNLPHGETVTRLRASAVLDPYSNEVTDLDWDNPTELDITNTAIEPTTTNENIEAGSHRLDIDLRLYVPYEADIEPLDRVVVRGDTFQVEGKRADWRNPYTGSEPGSVVEVRRVAS